MCPQPDPFAGPSRVPILMYHSLDESGSVLSIAPQLFRWQMHDLAARGYQGVGLARLAEAWAGRGRMPERPIVLTFDDGLANLAQHASSTLAELGFGATVFVVAGHVGGFNDWPGQPATIPRLPLLSWSQLEELAAGPFEIGAHSMHHPCFDRMEPAQVEREMVESRQLIEHRLGRSVASFAYPYGVARAEDRRLASQHFALACGTDLRVAQRHDDPFFLPRLDAYYLRNRALFSRFDEAAGRLYLRLRSMGRRIRRSAVNT